jgi:hypothetical protein
MATAAGGALRDGEEPDDVDLERHREIFVMLTSQAEVTLIRRRFLGGRFETFKVPNDDRLLVIYAERNEDWDDVHAASITRVLPGGYMLKLLVFAFHISPVAFVASITVVSAGLGALLLWVFLAYDYKCEFLYYVLSAILCRL